VPESPNSAIAFGPLPAKSTETELDIPVLLDVMTMDPVLVNSDTTAPPTLIRAAQLAAVSQFPEIVMVCGSPPSTETTRSSAEAAVPGTEAPGLKSMSSEVTKTELDIPVLLEVTMTDPGITDITAPTTVGRGALSMASQ
jgi:hypothetical protein